MIYNVHSLIRFDKTLENRFCFYPVKINNLHMIVKEPFYTMFRNSFNFKTSYSVMYFHVILLISVFNSSNTKKAHVEQDLFTLPELLRSPHVFGGFVLTSIWFSMLCFVYYCLSFSRGIVSFFSTKGFEYSFFFLTFCLFF